MKKRLIKKRKNKTATGKSRKFLFPILAILVLCGLSFIQGRYEDLVQHNENGVICSKVYSRVLMKISFISSNPTISDNLNLVIQENYQTALDLASKNDTLCLYYENAGDMIYNSYKEGFKDGKKSFLGRF